MTLLPTLMPAIAPLTVPLRMEEAVILGRSTDSTLSTNRSYRGRQFYFHDRVLVF